jgi:hypothetical protein
MKKTLLGLTLALSVMATSCLGPNRLYNSINNWNAEATEQDWLNEVIYLGLNIIPVYGIALFVDVIAINTIGYWGNNPVDDPGAFPDSWGNE